MRYVDPRAEALGKGCRGKLAFYMSEWSDGSDPVKSRKFDDSDYIRKHLHLSGGALLLTVHIALLD
jgi:hypothetical protein